MWICTPITDQLFFILLWSWLYGSCIYNYICNQSLSPLTLWARISLRQGVPDTTLCDKVCQLRTTGRWFSTGNCTSITEVTDRLFLFSYNHYFSIDMPCFYLPRNMMMKWSVSPPWYYFVIYIHFISCW